MNYNTIKTILSSIDSEIIKLLDKYPKDKNYIVHKLTKFTSKIHQRKLLTKYLRLRQFAYNFSVRKFHKFILYSYLRKHYNILKIIHISIPDYDDAAEFDAENNYDIYMIIQFDFGTVKIEIQQGKIICKTKKNDNCKPLLHLIANIGNVVIVILILLTTGVLNILMML